MVIDGLYLVITAPQFDPMGRTGQKGFFQLAILITNYSVQNS